MYGSTHCLIHGLPLQMKSLAIDLDSVDSFVSLLTMVQNAKDGKFVP